MDKIQSSLQLTVSALNTCMQMFMDTLDGYVFLAHPGHPQIFACTYSERANIYGYLE